MTSPEDETEVSPRAVNGLAAQLAPHPHELDDRRGRGGHVLHARPLAHASGSSARPVKMFGVGSPISERRAPSVPPRMSERTGSSPARRIASSGAATTRGCRVDRSSHVAVGLLTSTVTRARGSRSSIAAARLRTSSVCCVEQRVVVVAHDEDRRRRPPTDAVDARGVDETLAPLGRLGREASRAAATATNSAASLTAFTSLPFAVPGMGAAAPDRDAHLAGRERLDLELAEARAVERVGGLGAERLDVEVLGAAPDLLVDRERDPHRRPRLRRLAEVGDGRHDLRHAGLVVGAEQRRAVARDDVVADPRGERRPPRRGRSPGSGRRAGRSARRRSPRGRSGRRPPPGVSGVVSTWAISPITGAPGVPGSVANT